MDYLSRTYLVKNVKEKPVCRTCFKYIGWLALWISVSLFPSHPCHCPVGSWTRWPWWQKWRLHTGSVIWTPLTTAYLPTTTAKRLIYPQQRPIESPGGRHPQGGQPSSGRQDDYIGPLPSWRGQPFAWAKIDTDSGRGFAFLAQMLLPKLPSLDLQNAFSTIVLLLIKELTSYSLCCALHSLCCELHPHYLSIIIKA